MCFIAFYFHKKVYSVLHEHKCRMLLTYGPRCKKCLRRVAYSHRLISAFVIHLFASIIYRLATSEILIVYL